MFQEPDMKKSLLVLLFAIAFPFFMSADDFTDVPQDLAIQTACLGQYSATQAGDGWYRENATRIQNGVYIKTYGSLSYRNIRTHKTEN